MKLRKLAALTLVALSLTGLASADYVKTANGKSLNVRSYPAKADNIVDQLPYGTEVTVLNVENGWAQIRFEGATGYVMASYLVSTKPAPYVPKTTPSSGSSNSGTTTVTYDYTRFIATSYDAIANSGTVGMPVDIRWAPGKKASLRAAIINGTTVQVLASDGTWSQVYVADAGVCGFVESKYLVTVVGGAE